MSTAARTPLKALADGKENGMQSNIKTVSVSGQRGAPGPGGCLVSGWPIFQGRKCSKPRQCYWEALPLEECAGVQDLCRHFEDSGCGQDRVR